MAFSIFAHNDNLRPYQVEAKSKIYEAWETYDSVMFQMPTGTGKTYLFTSIVYDLLCTYKYLHKEITILVVAHRTELLDQISSTLNRFNIPHGFVQGQREQHLWKRVQVGSIMSLLTDKNYNNTVRQKFDFIIVDEAHHSVAETYAKLFHLFPKAKKLGLTATPWRLKHESFLKLYQTLVVSPQISWFIENKILADFDYISIKPDSEIQRLVNHSEIDFTGDFSNKDLDNTFNNQRIRSKVYDSYERFAKGKKGIVYAINRLHAEKLAVLYSSHGVKAIPIDCETPKEERQETISKFKKGEVDVLVNVNIFTEGFDCPDVCFIQLARPTRSLATYIQQVGRGLRLVQDKDKTVIIDNVGLYNYFGLPDANREWQNYFQGITDVEHTPIRPQNKNDFPLYDESLFEEDCEDMSIIKTSSKTSSNKENLQKKQKQKPNQDFIIREFLLGEYFLVHGNYLHFKIYPLIQKKGKPTGGVGSCLYEYDETKTPIHFTTDAAINRQLVTIYPKIQEILSFVCFRLHILLDDLLDAEQLCKLTHESHGSQINLFNLLESISKLHKNS